MRGKGAKSLTGWGARDIQLTFIHRRRSGQGEGGKCVTKVIVEADESFESALKRFKKQCEKSGLLSEFKKRQHYEKPSVRRKRKALAARKKAKRRERFFD